ncbi:ATP-dependent endonuclease [Saccharicrinis sp. FJH54]|uniref:ATP-dependent nuclease n=1 Tax=Saccharicrinis sp. FJH54 TaxID=3344665 RepID=UPI0035D4F560
MKLSTVKLKGFRNFKNATINFEDKTLIIGANDVGKTNLLWAIRLLLDRKLNDFDIEPKDSDFYAFEETNSFEIILKFKEVVEDCVVSRLKGKISDKDELCLAYKAFRDKVTKAKSYNLYAGVSESKLEEIEDRYYRKVLNVQYISSRRDFHSYINREKNYLFQLAKENRDDKEISADDKLYAQIQSDLKSVDDKIPKLNFIASATKSLNEELASLSLHHKKQNIVFDTDASNIDSFIKNVSIASNNNGENVKIGGDGRLNQIYLALWASRNELKEEKIEEVTIVCIEEPEAHLHPHQQRKLAEYLNSTINGQVFITSHSPQITCEFSPNSIVRLFSQNNSTLAASDGCSKIINDAFEDFGYRLSIIPAEAFFADVVLLIEGPSEELFYKTLAKQIGVDLDRLNISILMVDGVGFKTFIKILNSLNIDWVLRTDNDIFRIPKKDEYRFAGVQRCIDYYRSFFNKDTDTESILKENESLISGFGTKIPPKENNEAAIKLIKELEDYDLYISQKDLENDIFNSPIKGDLLDFFYGLDQDEIIEAMQKRKASFMYDFLKKKKDDLKKLDGDFISIPLKRCVEIVEKLHNEAD